MFLTREQIQQLTGYKNPVYQVRWLTTNGVRHWIDRTGRPQVPRSVIEGTGSHSKDDEAPFELGPVS